MIFTCIYFADLEDPGVNGRIILTFWCLTTYIYIYRVIQEESAVLWEMIVCVILSKKSSYEHGSDFERLRSYDRLELRIEGNDY